MHCFLTWRGSGHAFGSYHSCEFVPLTVHAAESVSLGHGGSAISSSFANAPTADYRGTPTSFPFFSLVASSWLAALQDTWIGAKVLREVLRRGSAVAEAYKSHYAP